MDPENDVLRRACETFEGYAALGNEVRELDLCRVVRDARHPNVWDANHVFRIRARTPLEIEAALDEIERALADLSHRTFRCDPLTPPEFEAELVLRAHRPHPTIQMLLEGELRADPKPVAIREVLDDADWVSLRHLTRLDHLEDAKKYGRPPHAERITDDVVSVRRAKAPSLRTWLGRSEGVECGYVSSFPGRNGVGMVEDLFTHPEFRHRGIATALIAHAVADARARGARPILIGANPSDTPMHMYSALGFRPLCVTRQYQSG